MLFVVLVLCVVALLASGVAVVLCVLSVACGVEGLNVVYDCSSGSSIAMCVCCVKFQVADLCCVCFSGTRWIVVLLCSMSCKVE